MQGIGLGEMYLEHIYLLDSDKIYPFENNEFTLGMFVSLKDTYYVKSNRESEIGRYDIMLEPKDKNANSFIIEFKVHKKDNEKDIADTIENAKKQIEEKQYETDLRERGFNNITKIVFAFKAKEVKMEVFK
jgi:hypothetical protein